MEVSWLEGAARRLVIQFLGRFIATGCVILMEGGGSVLTFEGSKTSASNLKVILRVHTPQFYWKVATGSDLGLADAYINGDFTLDDTNEGLLNLLMICITNTELSTQTSKLHTKRGWWTPLLFTSVITSGKYYLKHLLRRNTITQARINISDHYDLSNELFSLFLDETMSYSCAKFKSPTEDLESAQLRNYHDMIRKASVEKHDHVLEIGFGWGGLAIKLVKQTGCRYTGITLSKEQLEYAQLKAKEAGLQDQITFLLCDYRQVPKTFKYDRIISCEMFECVGDEYMEEFFRCCDALLAPNGLLVIQTTSIGENKYGEFMRSHGFIKEYIFPGGCIPSLHRITSAMAAASRLCVVHLEDQGRHYYPTLRCWRENLLKNQSEIMALGFDEKFIRKFEYYFDYCAAGFKMCTIGSYQIVFTRSGDVALFGDPYESTMYSS